MIFRSTRNTRPILPDSNRFIRSDVPTTFSEDELNWLLEEKITTIVDLREECECEQKPCPLEQDGRFQYLHFPVTGGNRIPETTEDVSLSYLNMVDDKMQQITNTIVNAEENVLYFCNAGKDRTGVVSALILRQFGMPEQYIIEDYMVSKENLLPMLLMFEKQHPEIDINIITPHPEYMEQFLKNV